MTLQGLTVEDCEVGVVVGRVPVAASVGAPGAEAQRSPAPPDAHTVNAVTVRQAVVGIWTTGYGGTITENIVGESQYGIVVSGDNVWVESNQVFNISKDGIMVVGDRNTIAGNRVDGAGQHGIDVIGAVPNVASGVYVMALRDTPNSNTIRDNIITNSVGYDLRQWPVSCLNMFNTFLRNTATKRNARCLY